MKEPIKFGVITVFAFLKQTGFFEGFWHGVSKQSTKEILESEKMKKLINNITIRINTDPNSAVNQLGVQTVTGIMKTIVECVIYKNKEDIAKRHKESIDEVKNLEPKALSAFESAILFFDETLINSIAKQSSLKNEEAEITLKIFLECVRDYQLLGKPLYTVGNKAGEYTVSFVKNSASEVYTYSSATLFANKEHNIRQRNKSNKEEANSLLSKKSLSFEMDHDEKPKKCCCNIL